MIKIENLLIGPIEPVIRGMRNPMNSWDRSDTEITEPYGGDIMETGPEDLKLMRKLALAGSEHAKYRRMIVVWCDITAPLYWWKEFDTYKVGTVANSCSTMHKIHDKRFDISDFSVENMYDPEIMWAVVEELNYFRDLYLEKGDKADWWQLIQTLPSSYNQKRTIMLNYEVLANIYRQRKNHKLDEWRKFCCFIEKLPLAKDVIFPEEGKEW